LNYLLSFCQFSPSALLKILLGFTFLSCTQSYDLAPIKRGIPVWFEAPKNFVITERDGTAPLHAFFDHVPEPNARLKELSMVVTTPMNSELGFDIDLISGKLYRQHRHCSENDVWGRRRRRVPVRPPVTMGFVPRLLDQAGLPHKVVVYGDSQYFQEFDRKADFVERVRVVGGGLLQYCDDFPCEIRERWLSRLVLIAVNPLDPKFSDIQTLDQLKGRVKWDELVTFMENGLGRNLAGADHRPAYRFSGDVDAARAFEHALSRGHLFEFSELVTMRRSCHALYDMFWEGAEFVRKQMHDRLLGENQTLKNLQDLEERRGTTPSFLFSNVTKGKLDSNYVDESKSPVPLEATRSFSVYLNHFLKNYGREYRACKRFVRDSSVKEDPRRHWFMSYVNLYFHLEDLGYIYVCSRRAWSENYLMSDGSRTYNAERERANCLPSQFDNAFETAVTMMTALRRSMRPHYRYIEFDTHGGGSHQPLFTWVHFNGKRRSCDQVSETEAPTFPSDALWEHFYHEDVFGSGVIR
jgi:hypothetical protein